MVDGEIPSLVLDEKGYRIELDYNITDEKCGGFIENKNV